MHVFMYVCMYVCILRTWVQPTCNDDGAIIISVVSIDADRLNQELTSHCVVRSSEDLVSMCC